MSCSCFPLLYLKQAVRNMIALCVFSFATLFHQFYLIFIDTDVNRDPYKYYLRLLFLV